MIYNFNLGIGWASSGVEYAQTYRASIFRKINKPAKFIFTDMFVKENIEHFTDNIGFKDTEIIWLYQYFTDFKIAPVTYTLSDLERSFLGRKFTFSRNGKTAKYVFENEKNFYTAYMVDSESEKVHRVEMVSNGYLVRKDFYTYGRLFSEYYGPFEGRARLYMRRFFNTNGSIAFEEIIDGDSVMYRMNDMLLYSKEELVSYFVKSLELTSNDTVIIDRTTGIGQSILMNASPAKVGIVIHADHFSEGATNEDYILWNNYYEYAFAQNKYIDFYITATDTQNIMLKKQFAKYMDVEPKVITIPVGSIDELKEANERKKSLITASRLASEKHVDWLVKAVVKAREVVKDVSLDIYGKGAMEDELRGLINEYEASDYITLMGQHDLTNVYQDYKAYLSGSTSEGFGLTLLEAIGAGLPIIGFDVRYGNQTFIEHEANGYLIDINDEMDEKDKVKLLSDAIIKMFTEANLESMHEHSYKLAKKYLTTEVEKQWKVALEEEI